MPSVTEIQLNKVRPLFPARFAPMILIGKSRPAQCMGRRMFGIKTNEQYKSIGIGPLYLQTEFEAV